jgi:hypothetical protein
MAAGNTAGREMDLLYAAGFVVGFLWGAIFAEKAERRAFERVA